MKGRKRKRRGGEGGKERGEVKQEGEEGIMNGPVQVVACITESHS